MDRRKFLKNSSLATAGLVGSTMLGPASLLQQCTGERKKPNILIILSDDLGFSDIGCFGSDIQTPNIDRLASNGIKFTQFYNTARCSPSRASLLTGLYPHQTGLGHLATTQIKSLPHYQGYLNHNCVTMAEVLKNEGYRTLMTGKWHVGRREEAWPTNRGFDRFYGEHTYVDGYFTPTNQLYLNGEKVEPEGEDWYSTDAYTDYALNFLDEDPDGEKPFFLYVAYNAAHFPLQAFQSDIDKYRGAYMKGWDTLREEKYQRLIDMDIIDPRWELTPRDADAPDWEGVKDKVREDLKMASYAAQIDRMDQNIGRLLDRLEERGELDNTLILFLQDNGASCEDWINRRNPEGVLPGDRTSMIAYGLPWANASNTPFRLFKIWVHEGGISTPLIAHWPDRIKNPGTISREVGHVMDLMPTVLDATGATYPGSYNGYDITPVEGKSLMPVFTQGTREGHEAIGWEHQKNTAFRKGKFKIARAYENYNKKEFRENVPPGQWQLYDMERDRTEMHDLSEKHPDILEDLVSDYQAWADRVGITNWDTVVEERRKQREKG